MLEVVVLMPQCVCAAILQNDAREPPCNCGVLKVGFQNVYVSQRLKVDRVISVEWGFVILCTNTNDFVAQHCGLAFHDWRWICLRKNAVGGALQSY